MSDEGVKANASIEQVDRATGVIWAAMILSIVTFGGVAFGIGPKEPAPGVDAGLMAIALLAVGASMALPCVVVRVLRDRAFDKAADAAAGALRYQQLAITAIAMGEGIGLIGAVALMMGLPLYVAAVLLPLGLGLVFVNKPSVREAAERARMLKDRA